MDSNPKLVKLSSNIQQSLSSMIENMPKFSKPSNFFDSLQSKPEVIRRRIKSGRSPATGLIQKVNSESPARPSTARTYQSQLSKFDISKPETWKLNTRVIESWINSTLSDAEYLDIPGCLLKPERKLPLTRYGIDRANLLVTPI